jgi:hypothetical protein
MQQLQHLQEQQWKEESVPEGPKQRIKKTQKPNPIRWKEVSTATSATCLEQQGSLVSILMPPTIASQLNITKEDWHNLNKICPTMTVKILFYLSVVLSHTYVLFYRG